MAYCLEYKVQDNRYCRYIHNKFMKAHVFIRYTARLIWAECKLFRKCYIMLSSNGIFDLIDKYQKILTDFFQVLIKWINEPITLS